MTSGKKKWLIWLAVGVTVTLLLLAGGVVMIARNVAEKVAYRYMAGAAGEAYGFYFKAKGEWPSDLRQAVAYAQEHAEKGSYLFGVTRDSGFMGYLEKMEVEQGIEKELSADMGSWEDGDERVMVLIKRGASFTPVRVTVWSTMDDGDRMAFAREFYLGVWAAMRKKEAEKSEGE